MTIRVGEAYDPASCYGTTYEPFPPWTIPKQTSTSSYTTTADVAITTGLDWTRGPEDQVRLMRFTDKDW